MANSIKKYRASLAANDARCKLRVDLPIDTITRLYREGYSINQIAHRYKVKWDTIRLHLLRAGIVLGPKRLTRIRLPIEEIGILYQSGWSENKLAKKYGVNRRAIQLRLKIAGVPRRNQSEAEKLRWTQMTLNQRKLQIQAAHKAKKGGKMSWVAKCKHAKTIENSPSNFSPDELKLQKMLLERGIETIHQKAIGGYNCDLAAYPVAVEVYGGNWHWTGRHMGRLEERFRYIMNAGWFIYVLPITKSFPLTDSVADHVATYIKRIRRDKPSVREYRVVWRAGEFTTTGSMQDDHITIVPPFTCARHLASGQYKRIAR